MQGDIITINIQFYIISQDQPDQKPYLTFSHC